MKNLLLIALILVSFESSAQEVSKEKYVVLISIDGFRPEFYLDTIWKAPTLQRLMKEGVYAEGVTPVFPSITYPNHISMITGVLPNKHGIYYNRPVNGKNQIWSSSMIKAPTLFDAVHTAGLTTSALFWPVMAEASIHYSVPSYPGVKQKNLSDYLNKMSSEGLWNELEQHAIGKLPVNELKTDENTGKMAAYIVQKYKPALTAIHLGGVDYAQHRVGVKDPLVAEALRIADDAISRVLRAINEAGIASNTTILIVGDHGFCDVNTSFSPNVWLKKKRLFKTTSRWKARFASNGSAFLYLKDPKDDRTLRRVRRILDHLPDDQKSLFRIIEKEELEKIGADPDAIFALNPVPGVVFMPTTSGKPFRQASGGAHGYYADFPEIMTGFVGWGNGLNPGTVIQQMNMPDIASIIARLLELDFNAEDGVLNESLFYKP